MNKPQDPANETHEVTSSAVKVAKIFVSSLPENEGFQSVFLARDKAVLSGKNSKPYMMLCLSDRTGDVDARIWDNVEAISNAFQNGDVVKVKGQVQIFQGRRQVVIYRLERAETQEYDMNDFIRQSEQNPELMFQQLVQIVERMQDRNIRVLTLDTLNDPEIRSKLLLAPAAKSIHHAYKGGLLEHILSICKLSEFVGAHYKNVKSDLLVFGAIFHDIGKIWELDFGQGITYTDKGQLLGHMVMAVELVEKKASRIMGFPEDLKMLCKHIILSHHGKHEYGSPKLPMFLEAYMVAALDDFDSKVNTISKFIDTEKQNADKWSRYNQMFERYFYLKASDESHD